MNHVAPEMRSDLPAYLPRETIALSGPVPGQAIYHGHHDFQQEVARLYSAGENNALEQLVQLKSRLRRASHDEFWELLIEGLATIAGAQWAFVSKRMVVEDGGLAIEMPPIGEPGSCLMAAAFYFNDGHGNEFRFRNLKYHAYSCPCAYMRHDRVLVIPGRLNDFILENPNTLPIPGESYLGVPLFADGKCFAHFGVMWSAEGEKNRRLSWGFLEMLFHALEDMILHRVLSGQSFAHNLPVIAAPSARPVIPHDHITTAQSLKPYARSLSHELRTPMQGVVGMLDVMYATVQEAAEDQKDPRMRKVLDTLRENIEIVQDSSRRAVEAADNVVHAYDMNMGIPVVPSVPTDQDTDGGAGPGEMRPTIVVTGNNLSLNLTRNNKRRRESVHWPVESGLKRIKSGTDWAISSPVTTEEHMQPARATASLVNAMATAARLPEAMETSSPATPPELLSFSSERTVCPGLRHTNLHDVLRYIINDSLKVGGRPESAIAEETERGEVIEVTTRTSSGIDNTKVIEWSVEPFVPESILIDERDLAKMISCVVLNAIKFTDQGKITITAKISARSRFVIISVKDTGCGIPAAFLPNLFKAFSREDDSLTRQSEGLGLGLLVAKGLSRKLGGDVYCVRSETSGPNRGSDFEMRIPLTPGDAISNHGSPHSSPTPSFVPRSTHSIERERTPVDPRSRGTPTRVADVPRSSMVDHRPSLSSTSSHYLATPVSMSPLLNRTASPPRRQTTPTSKRAPKKSEIDRNLAKRHPLTFLVAEDNKINRKLLVSMLRKLGYTSIREAYDGADAVRQWQAEFDKGREVDVVLMDLWMPYMDGYEATEKILSMASDDDASSAPHKIPTILAVTADVTDGALERAAKVGMRGFMTKPYKLVDLEKLIVEYCTKMTDDFS